MHIRRWPRSSVQRVAMPAPNRRGTPVCWGDNGPRSNLAMVRSHHVSRLLDGDWLSHGSPPAIGLVGLVSRHRAQLPAVSARWRATVVLGERWRRTPQAYPTRRASRSESVRLSMVTGAGRRTAHCAITNWASVVLAANWTHRLGIGTADGQGSEPVRVGHTRIMACVRRFAIDVRDPQWLPVVLGKQWQRSPSGQRHKNDEGVVPVRVG